jgi:hypothetical protein
MLISASFCLAPSRFEYSLPRSGCLHFRYSGIFAQGKNYEASRDSRYLVTASQTSMFPQQQLDTIIMGSGVYHAVSTEVL